MIAAIFERIATMIPVAFVGAATMVSVFLRGLLLWSQYFVRIVTMIVVFFVRATIMISVFL